jgi:hypothetical protein
VFDLELGDRSWTSQWKLSSTGSALAGGNMPMCVHGMGNAVTEAGTAEHLAFQHPQPVDIALDRA